MYLPEWLKYSHEQRLKLAEHFNLKKTRPIEVVGNTLVSDGYDDKQIYNLSTEECDELLGLNENVKDEKQKQEISTNKKGNKGKDGNGEDEKSTKKTSK